MSKKAIKHISLINYYNAKELLLINVQLEKLKENNKMLLKEYEGQITQ
jgi:hypothetical protein